MGVERHFSDDVLAQYLRRSYQAVDGLWFMTAEELLGHQQALELDTAVWEVLAKIQARKARELTGKRGNDAEELADCFSLKLTADGHRFECALVADAVRFTIHNCPWLALLRTSGREHLAQQVAQAVCLAEGRVWCREFDGRFRFEMPTMQCRGDGVCEMMFVAARLGDADDADD